MESQHDEKWFNRFCEIGAWHSLFMFQGNFDYREEQKKLFLKNKIENPVLDYPYLDIAFVLDRKKKLIELQKDIEANENNEWVKLAYLKKIEKKLIDVELALAADRKDMEYFEENMKKMFGLPSSSLYEMCHLSRKTNSEIDSLIKVFESVKPLVAKNLNYYINANLKEEACDAKEIASFFNDSLKEINAIDWAAIIDKNAQNIQVLQDKKKIIVPEQRVMTSNKLKALAAHEVGTHVARRVNGEKSNFALLGLGLDDFLSAEEGISLLQEKVISGELKLEARLDRFLAICWALGLDGEKRNFREVFEKFYSYQLSFNKEIDKEKLENYSWNLCIRIFRGTDCKTKGVCCTKDKIYLEGLVKILKGIELNPKIINYFSIGKFDPTNNEHLQILKNLEIIK